jgi:hypothetical protein
MTEDVQKLVFGHLAVINADLAQMREGSRTARAEIAVTRRIVDGQTALPSEILDKMGTVKLSLDRIERRLGIVSAPR